MDDPVLLNDWHPVASSAGLSAGILKPVRLLDRELVIWRGSDDSVRAWEDRCPHRGTRFSIGTIQDDQRTRCCFSRLIGGDSLVQFRLSPRDARSQSGGNDHQNLERTAIELSGEALIQIDQRIFQTRDRRRGLFRSGGGKFAFPLLPLHDRYLQLAGFAEGGICFGLRRHRFGIGLVRERFLIGDHIELFRFGR